MPHILCISSFFREQGGGVAHMAHCLAHELAAIPGNTVTLAAHVVDDGEADARNETYARMPIRAVNLFERSFGLPFLLPHPADVTHLRRAIQKADFALVHDSVYLANLAAIGAAHRHTPTIVIKHTGEVRFSNPLGRLTFGFFNSRILPHFLKKTSALAFVTQAKRDNFPAIEVPAVVIPNGIDTNVFVPGPADRRDSLLFVGRFVTKKGITVVREMARLMPDRHVVVAGYGPIDPRDWKQDNITCHWQPSPRELAELYGCCRAVILPGETEGTPLVALEALACDTPVVIGEMGAAPDRALSRQMAMLPVDVDQPEDTARQWCALLDSAIARSKPERAVIVESYSTERMARDYVALMERCGVGRTRQSAIGR